MRQAITGLSNRLEEAGFTRVQIGAALVGVGAGLVAAHAGRAWALEVLESAKNAAAPRHS